jgi:hypothetical protein
MTVVGPEGDAVITLGYYGAVTSMRPLYHGDA